MLSVSLRAPVEMLKAYRLKLGGSTSGPHPSGDYCLMLFKLFHIN